MDLRLKAIEVDITTSSIDSKLDDPALCALIAKGWEVVDVSGRDVENDQGVLVKQLLCIMLAPPLETSVAGQLGPVLGHLATLQEGAGKTGVALDQIRRHALLSNMVLCAIGLLLAIIVVAAVFS